MRTNCTFQTNSWEQYRIAKELRVLQRQRYDDEKLFDDAQEAWMSDRFFEKLKKMLSRLDRFMLCGNLGVVFSQPLYCYTQT